MNPKLLWIFPALLLGSTDLLEAQQPSKPPRVGLLRPGSPPDRYTEAFRQALADLGEIEGKTVIIEYRWLHGKPAALIYFAKELIDLKVEVIVTQGEVITRPVKEATSRIPIVMAPAVTQLGRG